jgi:transcription antitermination protein NusB
MCYQRDVTGTSVEDLVDRGAPVPGNEVEADERPAAPARPYTRELFEGVEQSRDELDEVIEQNAIGWHVDRIAPLERAILRVGLYEIMHRPDVPDEVAIDEAVESAKLYCGAEAPGFVNGVLGGALRQVRHG